MTAASWTFSGLRIACPVSALHTTRRHLGRRRDELTVGGEVRRPPLLNRGGIGAAAVENLKGRVAILAIPRFHSRAVASIDDVNTAGRPD